MDRRGFLQLLGLGGVGATLPAGIAVLGSNLETPAVFSDTEIANAFITLEKFVHPQTYEGVIISLVRGDGQLFLRLVRSPDGRFHKHLLDFYKKKARIIHQWHKKHGWDSCENYPNEWPFVGVENTFKSSYEEKQFVQTQLQSQMKGEC